MEKVNFQPGLPVKKEVLDYMQDSKEDAIKIRQTDLMRTSGCLYGSGDSGGAPFLITVGSAGNNYINVGQGIAIDSFGERICIGPSDIGKSWGRNNSGAPSTWTGPYQQSPGLCVLAQGSVSGALGGFPVGGKTLVITQGPPVGRSLSVTFSSLYAGDSLSPAQVAADINAAILAAAPTITYPLLAFADINSSIVIVSLDGSSLDFTGEATSVLGLSHANAIVTQNTFPTPQSSGCKNIGPFLNGTYYIWIGYLPVLDLDNSHIAKHAVEPENLYWYKKDGYDIVFTATNIQPSNNPSATYIQIGSVVFLSSSPPVPAYTYSYSTLNAGRSSFKYTPGFDCSGAALKSLPASGSVTPLESFLNLQGSGGATAANPFGLTLADIGGDPALIYHNQYQHSNGIITSTPPPNGSALFPATSGATVTIQQLNSGINEGLLLNGEAYNSISPGTSVITVGFTNSDAIGTYNIFAQLSGLTVGIAKLINTSPWPSGVFRICTVYWNPSSTTSMEVGPGDTGNLVDLRVFGTISPADIQPEGTYTIGGLVNSGMSTLIGSVVANGGVTVNGSTVINGTTTAKGATTIGTVDTPASLTVTGAFTSNGGAILTPLAGALNVDTSLEIKSTNGDPYWITSDHTSGSLLIGGHGATLPSTAPITISDAGTVTLNNLTLDGGLTLVGDTANLTVGGTAGIAGLLTASGGISADGVVKADAFQNGTDHPFKIGKMTYNYGVEPLIEFDSGDSLWAQTIVTKHPGYGCGILCYVNEYTSGNRFLGSWYPNGPVWTFVTAGWGDSDGFAFQATISADPDAYPVNVANVSSAAGATRTIGFWVPPYWWYCVHCTSGSEHARRFWTEWS